MTLPETAPAVRKNAEFDQSPSDSTVPGEAYFCPPGIKKELLFSVTVIPNFFNVLSVISIYGLDSTGGITLIMLLPFKSGSANKSPVINCELIFPLIVNSPDIILPFILTGNTFIGEKTTP